MYLDLETSAGLKAINMKVFGKNDNINGRGRPILTEMYLKESKKKVLYMEYSICILKINLIEICISWIKNSIYRTFFLLSFKYISVRMGRPLPLILSFFQKPSYLLPLVQQKFPNPNSLSIYPTSRPILVSILNTYLFQDQQAW